MSVDAIQALQADVLAMKIRIAELELKLKDKVETAVRTAWPKKEDK